MCLTLHDSPAKPPAATAGVTETVCVYGECRDSGPRVDVYNIHVYLLIWFSPTHREHALRAQALSSVKARARRALRLIQATLRSTDLLFLAPSVSQGAQVVSTHSRVCTSSAGE